MRVAQKHLRRQGGQLYRDDPVRAQQREEAATGKADERRVKTAILNKHKSYWKGIQRDVDRTLRELSVTEDHIAAHKWAGWNRSTLKRSDLCGCFYCLDVFPPNEIQDWTDDGDTAL